MQIRNYKIAVVLVIVGLIFSGCRGPQDVMTIGDITVTPGLYLAAQYESYQLVRSELNGATDFLEQSYEDGTTAVDKISIDTIDNLKKVAYAKVNFDDAGKTLTEEQQTTFDQSFDYNYENNKEILAENGIGEESYYDFSLGIYKFTILFEDEYLGEGESAPTIEEIADYFGDKYTPITRIDVSTITSSYTELSEDLLEEQKALADHILTHLEENNDFDAAVEEFMPDVLENAGSVYSEGTPSQYYNEDFVSEESTLYTAEDIATISAQSPGTFGTIEQWDRIVIYRVDEDYEEIEDLEIYRETLTGEMFYEEFEATALEEASSYNITQNDSALNYYSIDKVV